MIRFLCVLFIPLVLACVPVHAEQSINPELQKLKQTSLMLDRDLLLLEEKLKKPFSIFLSQKTDAKFVLETMVIKLDGDPLVTHQYTSEELQSLKQGGAQLIYTGVIPDGEHKLIAYYKSNKDYQGGAEFSFVKQAQSQAIEISLRKGESKESRLQPKVIIRTVEQTPVNPG